MAALHEIKILLIDWLIDWQCVDGMINSLTHSLTQDNLKKPVDDGFLSLWDSEMYLISTNETFITEDFECQYLEYQLEKVQCVAAVTMRWLMW